MLEARFTHFYNLIVIMGIAALLGFEAWLLIGLGAGWEIVHTPEGTRFEFTQGALFIALMCLVFVPLWLTHAIDLIRPGLILRIDHTGLFDRRLTRGPVRWDDIATLRLYRKGWQWVLQMDLKPAPVDWPEDYRPSMAYPIFALNRLAARWQKCPELHVGLGGLTVSDTVLLDQIKTYRPNLIQP
ncbi:hypothetical protein [Asticcacaulis sp. YBE204]|uniref:hypothetical protein n=1 Tax=Asticcacaulis sp. YBE204 TaxID=1282363 RepID=UPI0003C3C8B9|nr:hypothetical protein [Asticcacaulis sp. YBE204]ESQ80313.1 hypothetical protein AEYBE204_03365 [Asticcacaulis sp. YBE204]